MSQTNHLIRALKRVLKARGVTYGKVAVALDLSEATVKRMFSTQNLSLDRLDQICLLAGMDISDLVQEMEADNRRMTSLTEAQERELVSDSKLLMVAFLVVSGWRYEDIREHMDLSEAEVIRCLTRLDKLGMIDLLPGNRVKLLIAPNFAWLRNGPIQRHFTANFLEDFLGSGFDRRNESFYFLSGMLSKTSITTLFMKIDRLLNEFNELRQDDQQLPLSHRQGYSAVVAMRPWRPGAIKTLLK